MVRTLAEGKEFDHPTLRSPGWWQRLDRFCYPPVSHRHPAVSVDRCLNMRGQSSPPLLITGATGTLGQAFARVCEQRGLAYHLLTRDDMDIADPAAVESAITRFDPWAIVNTAGYVRVDDAEYDRQRCLRENAIGPEILATQCAARDIPLVTFSSDLVFNGKLRRPYVERDQICPINVYGATKAKAEQIVSRLLPKALVIRTSAFFGPWDQHNFAYAVVRALSRGETFPAANDATVSPTFVPDLVNATLDLLIDGEAGIWHLANASALSWFDFARLIANEAGYEATLIEGKPTRSFGFDARRPSHSALSSERATLLPPLEDAVKRFVAATSEAQTLELVPHEADLAVFPAPEIPNNATQHSRVATGSM
jgi:dTDP-4-dehydrorhamnose reductase